MYPMFSGPGIFGSYGNLGLYGALVAYGSINLTDASPPQQFVEPLSLAEVKGVLNLPERSPVDGAEFALLTAMITAARVEAEIQQNCDIVQKQWDLTFDYWPSYRVELRSPVSSVDLVQYRDSAGAYHTLTPDVDFIVDGAKHPAILAPLYNKTWPTFAPWPSSALLVRFSSGYSVNSSWWADTGAVVKQGMRYLISLWYTNRLPFQVGSSLSDALTTQLLSHGAVPRAR